MTLRFYVLGPPELRYGDASVALTEPHTCTLFTALAVSANTPVASTRLADALWETRPAHPAAEVSSAMAVLRGALRPVGEPINARLLSRCHGHLLSVDRDELDLDRFTMLLRQGRAALDAEDHYAAKHLLGKALVTWRGPAGAGSRPQGWLRERLADVDELRASAAEGRLAAQLALGQAAQVVAEAEALLTAEPLRERWWAFVIAGLRDGGDGGAARAARDQARRVYAHGVGPPPDRVRRLLDLALLPKERRTGDWIGSAVGPESTADRPGSPALEEEA